MDTLSHDTDEIFEDMLANPVDRKKHRSWPFKTMAIGQYMQIETHTAFKAAMNAANQITARKGYKFKARWLAERGYGIIGRSD